MYKDLIYTTRAKALRDLGISYLGDVACSTKLTHSLQVNVATYGIYLLQSNLSGYSVCPNDKHCKEHCLGNSGHNMMDIISGKNQIKKSRLKKTKLLFENKDFFMRLLIDEIKLAKANWEKKGYFFAVRINCSSDINIAELNLNGKNITQIFSDVTFYDYTKVFKYLDNIKKFPNLYYTYSYNGYNHLSCKKALEKGVNIAVCFENKLPKYFNGIPVINGDNSDFRPNDPKRCIVGLKLKTTSNMIKDHKFVMPSSKFIVPLSDKRCS